MILSLFKRAGGRTLAPPIPDPRVVPLPGAPPIAFSPPEPRPVIADVHIWSLISLAFSDGLRGHVRPQDLLKLYPELCFAEGYAPLSEQRLLCELGTRLKKTRLKVKTQGQKRKLTYYVLPGTHADNDAASNVVPFRAKPPAKAQSRRRSCRSTRARVAAGGL